MPAATSPPTTFADWFNRQRRHLAGNGLWLDGGEPGRQPPAEFATARVRILFCRLSTYAGTTPSITHRLLYWAARQCPGVYADLAFLPPATDTAFLQREGVPWWLATGSKQPPAAFDIVAVSLSVPQETINLPAALKHSGLHLGARQRLADPAQPIILLGGNAAPSAPFLHGDAAGDGSGGLVDAVCNGDGITFLQRFLAEFDAWKHPRQRQADANAGGKAAFLARLAGELPGLYVPTLYTHATATGAAGTPALTITPAAESAPFPVAYRTDPPESWLEGYDGGYIPFANEDLEETLPLAIGCHYRCRFCQTGWGRGPETDSPVPALAQAARRLKAATAASDLNLLAADAASVPALHEALAALRPLFRQVSLKSLAVTSLAKEDTARDFLARLDKHEFSLGVEGISHRLRAWLGKQCDPDDLLRVLRTLAPLGLRQVKLFLIATGRETAADVTEFLELLANLRAACPAGRFILSFTPLFHAPFTPLQFAPIHPPDPTLFRHLANGARNLGGELRWSATPEEIRFLNRLTRAGRRATPALVRLGLTPNARYGDSLPATVAAEGEKLLAATLATAAALDALDAETAHPLDLYPWDDFAGGTPRKLLWKAYLRAGKDLAHGPLTDSATAAAADGFPGADEEESWLADSATTAEPPPPPPRRLPLPEPVRETETVLAWATLLPAAAWQPDATLARGLLRDRFLDDPAEADRFAGHAALLRLPHCAGLARLAYERWRQPGAQPAAAPAAGPALPPPEQWLWLVRTPQLPESGWRRLEAWLKERKAKFQTRRDGTTRRQLVAKNFHAKLGLLLLAQDSASGAAWAICGTPAAAAPFLAEFATAAGAPPTAEGLFRRAPGRCLACGAEPLLESLAEAPAAAPAPFCPACSRPD